MPVLINNLQEKFPVEDDLENLITRVVNIVLSEEGYPGAEVSVALVSDEKIAELNKKYRRVHSATDVLSFAMYEGEIIPDESGEFVLGDVIISLETAHRQAGEFGHSIEREVAYLTVHGVLHLLGYDHLEEAERKQMREREELVMKKVKLSRS